MLASLPDRDVILKLLAFTLAMIVVPIGSYFATVNTLFRGKQSSPLSPSGAISIALRTTL